MISHLCVELLKKQDSNFPLGCLCGFQKYNGFIFMLSVQRLLGLANERQGRKKGEKRGVRLGDVPDGSRGSASA